VVRIRDVVPRLGLPPLFSLFACRHAAETESECALDEPLVVRDGEGELSDAMQRVRAGFGFTTPRGDAEGRGNPRVL